MRNRQHNFSVIPGKLAKASATRNPEISKTAKFQPHIFELRAQGRVINSSK